MSNGNKRERRPSIACVSHNQKKLDEVQSILDRWEERLRGHHGENRRDVRKRFRAEILLHIPTVPDRNARDDALGARCVRAWARNVSCNGISFLHRDKIDTVEVAICLDPQATQPRWFRGKIVRAREVQNDYWEYGVCLTGRVEGHPE